ncbi:hypothetical protein [uncultured Planococcus sp.]|uniref:hypothetical protein n=1 Tax=uncultured Planococcus sp. TaxID=337815 RepID=UPI00262C72E4|nr:hypothetical protein [uncultured Planococcus sp.]
MYIGIALAVIYCFAFWKFGNLGRFRIPLFIYAVIIQFLFLILFAWTNNRFRTDESFSREYVNIFGNGIILFYFLMVVPLLAALWVHTYKGVEKLEVGKISRWVMIGIFIVFTLISSTIGFYLHVFFYYGFAP